MVTSSFLASYIDYKLKKGWNHKKNQYYKFQSYGGVFYNAFFYS